MQLARGVINITKPTTREYPRVEYFRPDGAQGVRISVQIPSAEQEQKLKERLNITQPESNVGNAILRTISELGLARVEP